MADVEWSEPASEELDQIVDYIELFDAVAAERIARRLVALGESLADFPHRGRPGRSGTRELATVSPYILHYDVTGDRVTILHVRHGARRPLSSHR